MKELILTIARALVENPESVSVREIHGGHTTVLELQAAKSDLGKIIGKKGRNARAIRVLLGAASAKQKKRVVLEILDSDDTKTMEHQLHPPGPFKVEKVYVPCEVPRVM